MTRRWEKPSIRAAYPRTTSHALASLHKSDRHALGAVPLSVREGGGVPILHKILAL